MTLTTETTKQKSRPFLVLPLLENLKKLKMPKNPNLKLFTKTWPPKRDPKKDDRPLTATLDKPTVLNISLIGIIDMSTVRKEFLNISNLCRLSLTMTKRKKTATINRPLSLPSPEKHKVRKRPETGELEDKSVQSAKPKTCKSNKIDTLVKKKTVNDSNNNTKTFKIPRKRVSNVVKLLEVGTKSSDLGKSTKLKLPEPCKTCGRPDQPERFHSHPPTSLKKKLDEPPKMKSTVQKPVAMKYQSKKSTEKNLPPTTQRKPSLPAQKLVHSPRTTPEQTTPRVKSAKRTLTCYLCGREFGTASLSLHEPKCLQKWERENAALPQHLQRKAPSKPNHSLNSEEWNKFAWESSQASLTPCSNCGRTFYPDRLIVHQRSCKILQDNASKSPVDKSIIVPSPMPPPSIECYICNKLFTPHSIKIHEKQCLKKWNAMNEALPAELREPEPLRKDVAQSPQLSSRRSSSAGKQDSRRDSGIKSPNMFPCYICGRLFTVNSIYIHEPQCLKMWKVENDKLPSTKRRQIPLKPDVKWTQDGKVDFEATNEAKWQSHLNQLIPCQFCSRTFNPERVEVHERSCKG